MEIARNVSISDPYKRGLVRGKNLLFPPMWALPGAEEKNYLETRTRTYIVAIVVAPVQMNCFTYEQLTLNPN